MKPLSRHPRGAASSAWAGRLAGIDRLATSKTDARAVTLGSVSRALERVGGRGPVAAGVGLTGDADLERDITETIYAGMKENASALSTLAPLMDLIHVGSPGSYATPVHLADLMARLGLIRWLLEASGLPTVLLARLVYMFRSDDLPPADRCALSKILWSIKVCDPAAGGGILLLAVLEALADTLVALGVGQRVLDVRVHLVQNCLHGTELDPLVAAIARQCLSVAARWPVLCSAKPGIDPDVPPDPGPSTLVPRVFSLDALRPLHTLVDRVGRPDGSNIVLTNPPYVRHEQLGRLGQAHPKGRREECVVKTPGVRPSGRADLFVPFFPLIASLLEERGVSAILTSNAWLDSGYGAAVRDLVANQPHVTIVDSGYERWFSRAEVNTALVLAGRGEADGCPIRFVSLHRRLADLNPDDRVELALSAVPRCRRVHDQRGLETTHSPSGRVADMAVERLEGNPKWGQYLRIPSYWLEIASSPCVPCVPLIEVADVGNGLRTGCNAVFVVRDVTDDLSDGQLRARFGRGRTDIVASGCRMVVPLGLRRAKHDPTSWWMLPSRVLLAVLLNARECRTMRLSPGTLQHRLLVLEATESSPLVRNYIRWAKGSDLLTKGLVAKRRSPWWVVATKGPYGPVIYGDHHHDRAVVALNDIGIPVSNNFFVLRPHDPQWTKPLLAFLVSSPGLLERERLGRVGLGGGGLKTDGSDIKLIRVPDPSRLTESLAERLSRLVEDGLHTPIRSIPTDPGADDWRTLLDREILSWMGLDPAIHLGRIQEALRSAIDRRLSHLRAPRQPRPDATDDGPLPPEVA